MEKFGSWVWFPEEPPCEVTSLENQSLNGALLSKVRHMCEGLMGKIIVTEYQFSAWILESDHLDWNPGS
jgi:hypothetical protein